MDERHQKRTPAKTQIMASKDAATNMNESAEPMWSAVTLYIFCLRTLLRAGAVPGVAWV